MRGRPTTRSFAWGAPASLWRATLSQIPTLFGKLAYLSSLRNANSGLYEHQGMIQIYGEQETDTALRESHQQLFEEWLGYPLAAQKADILEYLRSQDAAAPRVVETWLRIASYRNLVPASAREAERQLFLSDLETLLQLLRNEYGVVVPDQDA